MSLGRSWDAGKKVNGTKRHVAVDTLGLLLVVLVTAASVQDRDGGYAGRLVTWAKARLALTVEIVKRSDDMTGFVVLPRRWVVERTLSWICRRHRCVRDYEGPGSRSRWRSVPA